MLRKNSTIRINVEFFLQSNTTIYYNVDESPWYIIPWLQEIWVAEWNFSPQATI